MLVSRIPVWLHFLMIGMIASLPLHAQESVFAKRQASIHGIVVIDTNAGLVGKTLDIIVTVDSGDKEKTRFERSVGEQMATSLTEAVRAVQVHHHEWDGTQLRVSFGDKYSLKDGGSAGTAYAVCIRSILEDFEIDPKFAMTGDITVDQRVREVGGVSEKIQGAAADGIRVVGVPSDNADALTDMLLLESPQLLLDTQVFLLETLDDAVALARFDRDASLLNAMDLFTDLQTLVKRQGYRGLRAVKVRELLGEIHTLAPNHTSADLLLKHVNKELPRHLSVTGSLNEIMRRGVPAFGVMDEVELGQVSKGQRETMQRALKDLQTVRLITHPDLFRLRDAFIAYVSAGNNLIKARSPSARHVTAFRKSADNLVASFNEVSSDSDAIRALIRGE